MLTWELDTGTLWEIELFRTSESWDEHREKRPDPGETPGEKADRQELREKNPNPGRTPGEKAEPGRNPGRKAGTREKRREKRPTGRKPGEPGCDSESPGEGRDKTSKMTFSRPLSQVFPCGVTLTLTLTTQKYVPTRPFCACTLGAPHFS